MLTRAPRIQPGKLRFDTQFSHQAVYPPLAAIKPLLFQKLVHSCCAIATAITLMRFLNARFQLRIVKTMLTRWAAAPGVVATAGDIQQFTQALNSVVVTVLLDKSKP